MINMVIFCMHRPYLSDTLVTTFKHCNNIFLVIFICEATLKISCLGTIYFHDSYNRFDFAIICLSITTQLLEVFNIIEGGNQASILRVFRLGRVLRLVNKAKSLRMIFNTFLISLPSLANIGLLLLLIQFIYTILGVELYSFLKRQENINQDANFEEFSSSFLTLFRVSTGEGWNFIMDDMIR